MNSKKNSFKRVAAGALAVLTVAAYTAPVANVGGLPSVKSLVAEAAAGDTLVTFGTAAEYITNATDGTNSAGATVISGAGQFKFTANTVLTISSKVPLDFGVGYDNLVDSADPTKGVLPYTTNLLEKTAAGAYKYNKKYLVTENSNGTYTYKVRVVENLAIDGVTTSVNVVNKDFTADESIAKRTDGSGIPLTALNVDVFLNTTDFAAGNKLAFTAGTTANYNLVKKSTAKIYASKAFEVYVKDNTNDQAAIVTAAAKYDAEVGKFVAEAPIPATTTDAATNVSIYINKVTPNYTYSYANNNTALVANATNAPQVTAASITATYEAKVKKNKGELLGGETGKALYKYDTIADMASGATVPNESRVVLTFTNDITGEITSVKDDINVNTHYALKITKDGKELTDAATPFFDIDGAYGTADEDVVTTYANVKSAADIYVPGGAATDNTNKLAFSATGTYKVEYTVYTKTIASNGTVSYTPRTLVYNFTIAPKTALTAKNVRLTATGNNLNGGANITKVGIVNGVVQFEVSENWKNTDIIDVSSVIFDDADVAATLVGGSNFAAGAADDATTATVDESKNGTPKSVIGTTRSNTLNQVNEMTIVYNNPEFSSSDQVINVKWKLVEAKKAIRFTKNDDYTAPGGGVIFTDQPVANENVYFQTTVDQLKTFRDDLFETMTVENADIDDISFEYVSGYGITPTTEVLNYHEDGLPTEAGKYSVFFVYEGEIVASVNVKVSEHALFAKLSANQLSYTYGTKAITSDDLVFVDVNGKTVKDAGVKNATINYYTAQKLTASQIKKITADNTITFANATADANNNAIAAGTYKIYSIGTDKYIKGALAAADTVDGYKNAGNYIVEVLSTDGFTSVEKKGYELQTATFAVSVAKKALTADMVVFDAVTYLDGATVLPGAYKVVDTAVKDAAGNAYNLRNAETSIAGGTTSAQNIGEYTIGVQVIDANSNYTGKVNAKWHVVKAGQPMAGIVFSDAKTTIYDNGQIHFEITRPDDTQFANGVAKYGVVIDKEGKIAAPTKYENNGDGILKYPRKSGVNAKNNGANTVDEFAAAANALQIGNGFKEGNQGADQKAATPLKYGANIAVKNVETGAWFRPYVIDGKGNIFYGEVIYVNLVQEATDVLKLTMANSGANALVANDATSGLNTRVVTKDAAKENQSAANLASKKWREDVQSGYDKTSNRYYVYGSYTLEGNDLVKQSAVQGFGVVVDKKGAFTPAGNAATNGVLVSDGKTTVADGLKLGKGFIEGKGGSNKMDVDEYGAMIVPADSVTGVWVRAYVDLGNDLIVYTEPVYITDVSTYFDAATALDTVNFRASDNKQGDKHYISFTADQNPVGNNLAGATLKSSGVIVDNSGKYLAKNPATGDYLTGANAVFADAATATKANSEMLLGKGFLQGKKTGAGQYKASVAPKYFSASANNAQIAIPIVARQYAVYTIGDVEVTIYGAPVIFA